MSRKTMIEAIRDAIDVMMGLDDNVVVFGEDVGYFGGVFRATRACRRSTARAAVSIHRLANLGSWAQRLVWLHTDFVPASKSNLLTTCIRHTTRSCPRPHDCAIAPTVSSPVRSWCEWRLAAESLVDNSQPKPRGAIHPRVRP